MKKIIKKSLVTALVLGTAAVHAGGFDVTSSPSNKKLTKVSFAEVDKGSFFYIKDSNGHILYKEVINNEGRYVKNFDLTGLPDATYHFELDESHGIKVIPFMVRDKAFELSEGEDYEIHKPLMKVMGQHVYFLKESVEKQSWRIAIYYENGDLALQESFRKTNTLKRAYDFSGSKKGKYTVLITSSEKSFNYEITI